jgi:hypothetical protein
MIHYLQDFTEAFAILFRAYLLLLAGGIVAVGVIMAIVKMLLDVVPYIIRRFG